MSIFNIFQYILKNKFKINIYTYIMNNHTIPFSDYTRGLSISVTILLF